MVVNFLDLSYWDIQNYVFLPGDHSQFTYYSFMQNKLCLHNGKAAWGTDLLIIEQYHVTINHNNSPLSSSVYSIFPMRVLQTDSPFMHDEISIVYTYASPKVPKKKVQNKTIRF